MSIIGLVFTFIDKCRARIGQRNSMEYEPLKSSMMPQLQCLSFCEKYNCQKQTNTNEWYECREGKVHCNVNCTPAITCSVQDCELPCKGSLNTLFPDAIHPLMYLSLAPDEYQKDFSSYMQYLRATMRKMMYHGLTESYEIYSRTAALLVLSFLYSQKPNNDKHAAFL